ncbi:MAG: BtpA/SgcQ family protein [Gemmatimonadota bacterium]|nr:BtpA/SgcQ family protein [Gemmatimonadota bacterium]
MSRGGLRDLWPDRAPLVGMVHLLPLPGSPDWGGAMEAVIERAVTEARILTDEGYDGLIVENYSDVPFFARHVQAETIAAMSVVVARVMAEVSIPVGVNVLRNDAHAALGVATATGARFIRINVHTGSMWTDQGLIEGRAAHTLRTRSGLGVDVKILADVHVKHASPPPGSTIADAAADAWHRGRADALIVSGSGTGSATDPSEVSTIRGAVAEAPVLIGSGASPETVRTLLDGADGVIVGSAIMADGLAGRGVDPVRARTFIQAARGRR